MMYNTYNGNPSILQTTEASDGDHISSQTVPHIPLYCTSTRPSLALLLPTSRTFMFGAVSLNKNKLKLYKCRLKYKTLKHFWIFYLFWVLRHTDTV
jgi:hypothetical protein